MNFFKYIFNSLILTILVTPLAHAYNFTSANAAEWNGTYTSSSLLPGGFLHTETDVITGKSVVGSHTFTDGVNSGSFDWTAILSKTAPHLVGSGIINNFGVRPFTIISGNLYFNPTTNNFTLYWNANDPVFGAIGWTTMKAAPFLGASGGTIAPVPEPETYAMLLAGLGLVGVAVSQRNRLSSRS